MILQPDISLSRQCIRQQIRERYHTFNPEQRRLLVQQAVERVVAWPPVILAYIMALFLPFDGGLDTQPLIDQFWRTGRRVYLPVPRPFNPRNLLFLYYYLQSQPIVNRLKVHESKLDVWDVLPPAKLDVLVTPLTTFDVSGQRLGIGGSFYDRTLQNWQQYCL